MKVLITNRQLVYPGGTETYVRDLAKALHARGIHVEVYCPILGPLADEIRLSGINIVDSIEDIKEVPDVIHAHHFIPSMDAIVRFSDVPVVSFLHDRTNALDNPPRHKNVVHYVAVDYNCLDRLIIDNAIDVKSTSVVYNWVDTKRFRIRGNIAPKPTRALVFSNYGNYENHFKLIKEACGQLGIEVDGIGIEFKNSTSTPEKILGNYDIVFAKAKAAMEALATGAAVIACDYRGLGEMVTPENFDHYRKYNFGMKTLTREIKVDLIVQEMKKYNAAQNAITAKMIHKEADFSLCVDKILVLYHQVIKKYFEEKQPANVYAEKTIRDYLLQKSQACRYQENLAVDKRSKIIFDYQNEVEEYKRLISDQEELAIGEKIKMEKYKRLAFPDYPLRAAIRNLFVQIFRKLFKPKNNLG